MHGSFLEALMLEHYNKVLPLHVHVSGALADFD